MVCQFQDPVAGAVQAYESRKVDAFTSAPCVPLAPRYPHRRLGVGCQFEDPVPGAAQPLSSSGKSMILVMICE